MKPGQKYQAHTLPRVDLPAYLEAHREAVVHSVIQGPDDTVTLVMLVSSRTCGLKDCSEPVNTKQRFCCDNHRKLAHIRKVRAGVEKREEAKVETALAKKNKRRF